MEEGLLCESYAAVDSACDDQQRQEHENAGSVEATPGSNLGDISLAHQSVTDKLRSLGSG
jgi:hypothetical protein